MLMTPMAEGSETIGSMGLTLHSRFSPQVAVALRFAKLFAQVTNPPVDTIQEELVCLLPPPLAQRQTCSTNTRMRVK